MSLEYSIYENSAHYYEVSIPVASYYRDEGLLLNATVYNHWRGFNDESFSWMRIEDNVVLFNDDEETMIDELSLNEFEQWLHTLHDIYSYLEEFKPIVNILESLLISNKTRVNIGFY